MYIIINNLLSKILKLNLYCYKRFFNINVTIYLMVILVTMTIYSLKYKPVKEIYYIK